MPLSPSPSDVKIHLEGVPGGKGVARYGAIDSSTGATPSLAKDGEDAGKKNKGGGCGCCGRQWLRDSHEGWVLGVGALLGALVAAAAVLVGVFFSGLDVGSTSTTKPPAAVAGAAVASVTPSSAVITFDKPEAGSGSAPVTRYEAQQQLVGQQAQWANVSLPELGLSGSFTAEGLLGSTRYCWRVAAINIAGAGLWSAPACGETSGATAPPRPAAPHQTFAAGSGAIPSTGELVVAWDAAEDTGGSPIARYEVYDGEPSANNAALCSVTASTNTSSSSSSSSTSTSSSSSSPGYSCSVDTARLGSDGVVYPLKLYAVNALGRSNGSEPLSCAFATAEAAALSSSSPSSSSSSSSSTSTTASPAQGTEAAARTALCVAFVPPSAPSAPKAEAIAADTARVSWSAVPGAEAYELQGDDCTLS